MALLALLGCAAAEPRRARARLLIETVGEQGQVSVAWSLPASQSQSPDLPLDATQLVRFAGRPLCARALLCYSRMIIFCCHRLSQRVLGPALTGGGTAAARCCPNLSVPKRAAQVRTVTGFQPEGIHLTQWTPDQMLVSWQTGGELCAMHRWLVGCAA